FYFSLIAPLITFCRPQLINGNSSATRPGQSRNLSAKPLPGWLAENNREWNYAVARSHSGFDTTFSRLIRQSLPQGGPHAPADAVGCFAGRRGHSADFSFRLQLEGGFVICREFHRQNQCDSKGRGIAATECHSRHHGFRREL